MIGGMDISSVIGLALITVASSPVPAGAETKAVTLEPIRIANPEFDQAGQSWQFTGTESADAGYWSPKKHGAADAEWFEGEVATLGTGGGCTASCVLPADAVVSGASYRIGFNVARWGPDLASLKVSIEDGASRPIASSGSIEAGLWRRRFVDLEIPSGDTISGPFTLVFRTVENKDAVRESTVLLDKVSMARIGVDEPGFQSLFNGRDLTGWIGNVKGYGVENGAIRTFPERAGGNLYTQDEFGDFVFRFAFKVPPGANNGIAIRAPSTGDAAFEGMEVQVLDNSHPKYAGLKPWQFHGSVYGISPALRGYQASPGEWNLEEIRADGRRIRVVLNGMVISEFDLDEAVRAGTLSGQEHPGVSREKGHLGFCGHGDLVYFKDLRVQPIFRPESKP